MPKNMKTIHSKSIQSCCYRISSVIFLLILFFSMLNFILYKDEYNRIISAIENNDTQYIGEILDKGVNPNLLIQTPDPVNWFDLVIRKIPYIHHIDHLPVKQNITILSYAVAGGRNDVVKLLLNKGASPNPKDNCFGVTPLEVAVWDHNDSLAEMLILAGADTNVGSDEFKLLKVAESEKNFKLIQLLKEYGAH